MARLERDIRAYQLIIENDLDGFNEIVNCHIEDGYQFMNSDGARVEEMSEGMITYRTEMVRYVPDQVMVDPRATTAMNIPTVEHERRMEMLRGNPVEDTVREDRVEAVEETEMEVPPPNRPFWTADSPDPFDGEVDDEAEEAGEMNDHQLTRLGALRQEFDDEVNDVMEVPRALREAVMDMREAGVIAGGNVGRHGDARDVAVREIREALQEETQQVFEEARAESNVHLMDGGMAEMAQAPQQEAPQTETVMDMLDNAPF